MDAGRARRHRPLPRGPSGIGRGRAALGVRRVATERSAGPLRAVRRSLRADSRVGGSPACDAMWQSARALSEPLPSAKAPGLDQRALRHREELYAIALRLTGQAADASDLVQDVFERLLRTSARLRPDTNLGGWMATTLHHLFIDRVRRKGVERTAEGGELERLPAPEPEEASTWSRVEDQTLTDAIAALPDEFREVFALHSRGLSYQQIAERLDIPRATVGTRLARARRRLREQIAPAEKENGR